MPLMSEECPRLRAQPANCARAESQRTEVEQMNTLPRFRQRRRAASSAEQLGCCLIRAEES